jgi:cytochrome c-type biogenesis protein CcmH/NrfG
VLLLEPKNVKALFRRGTARTRLGDYADARADLRRACELDPKSREIREMFEECKVAEADAKEEQRAFYSNTKVAEGGYEAPPEEPKEKPFIC